MDGTPRIAIVDYGMGNLHSVRKAFEACGAAITLTRDPDGIAGANALVVPGVGSFGDGIENLSRTGLKGAIAEFIRSGRPYLGLCLGLQILFSSSDEAPGTPGLAVIPGRIRKFTGARKVPHMGWNTLCFTGRDPERCPLFRGIENGTYVYFVHSYYPQPEDRSVAAAITEYGIEFVSAVWRGALMATQFHPEKSQRAGLAMLRNFVAFCAEKARGAAGASRAVRGTA